MTVANRSVERKKVPVKDLSSSFPVPVPIKNEDSLDVASIAKDFLSKFSTSITSSKWDEFGHLFTESAYWKDAMTLTFDKRTIQGRDKIVDAWKSLSMIRVPQDFSADTASAGRDLGPANFKRMSPQLAYLEVPFSFTTQNTKTKCVGSAKLVATDSGDDAEWKVWILSTDAVSLQDYPFQQLPLNHKQDYIESTQRGCTVAQGFPKLKTDEPLDAIVIGGSSCGLADQIQLESIGAKSIVLDLEQTAGGLWSLGRYENVTLHHGAFHIQLPQFPVPSQGYPNYLKGDEVAQYYSKAIEDLKLAHYAGIQVVSNTYDEQAQVWKVTVLDVKSGDTMSIKTRNLAVANGFLLAKGNAYVPPLENRDSFKGSIQHSTEVGKADPYKGKDVVIVGVGTSAHDIANLLATRSEGKGAKSVTIIQRSPIALFDFDVISPMFTANYSGSIPVDNADFMQNGMPVAVSRDMAKGGIKMLLGMQEEFNKKLEDKGYVIDREPCLMTKAYENRGGGFYMDHPRTLNLVLQDKIKIVNGSAIACQEDALVVKTSKGERIGIQADAIILATGFESINLPKRWSDSGFFDSKSASKLENVGEVGVDAEGEVPGYYTASGHPHVFFSGGPMVWSRWISRYAAIQIMADVKGISLDPIQIMADVKGIFPQRYSQR